MTHKLGRPGEPSAALDYRTATRVAEILSALATPSRLMILACLRESPANVSDIVQYVGIERTTVSQQLRVLRSQGLVVAEKDGRHVNYRLFDDHVSRLVDEAVFHSEHLQLRRASEILASPRVGETDETVDDVILQRHSLVP
jgi:ArsR family transcriptional regulator, nickel/cobalt-responsive transcriptional repressor